MQGILLGRPFGMSRSSLTGNIFHRPPKAKQDYPPSAKASICKTKERIISGSMFAWGRSCSARVRGVITRCGLPNFLALENG